MRKIYFVLLYCGLASAVVAEEGVNVASLSDEGYRGWRTELSLMNGLPATNYRRDDDVSAAVTLDYELAFASSRAILRHLTVSVRVRPAMVYHQDALDRWLYALGGGFALRLYRNPGRKVGWFAEMAEELLFHSEKFQGNSTHFNVLSQFGAGYQWRSGLFLGLRFQHASNARLGQRNSGVNAWGVFAGSRF